MPAAALASPSAPISRISPASSTAAEGARSANAANAVHGPPLRSSRRTSESRGSAPIGPPDTPRATASSASVSRLRKSESRT